MENYMLYNEIYTSPAKVTYKARYKQTILYFGIQRYDLSMLDLVTNNVQSLHSLQHKNVIQFIEWCQSPQHVWMVTELVDGGTLAKVIDSDGHMAPETACLFLSDIAAGLQYIHSQKIIFCDLIPSKILLDCHGNLKISDFSLCQRVTANKKRWKTSDIKQSLQLIIREINDIKENGDEEVTMLARHVSLETLPSPFYKSPEVMNDCDMNYSSDMWSLGCILHELLTGQCPFYGTIDKQLSSAVVKLDVRNILVVSDDYQYVQNIVSGLLQKDSKKRLNWSNADLQKLAGSFKLE